MGKTEKADVELSECFELYVDVWKSQHRPQLQDKSVDEGSEESDSVPARGSMVSHGSTTSLSGIEAAMSARRSMIKDRCELKQRAEDLREDDLEELIAFWSK